MYHLSGLRTLHLWKYEPLQLSVLSVLFFGLFREMGQSGTDSFKLKRDWLSVQEVVDAVTSPSCGAISVFIGEEVFTSVQTFPF